MGVLVGGRRVSLGLTLGCMVYGVFRYFKVTLGGIRVEALVLI